MTQQSGGDGADRSHPGPENTPRLRLKRKAPRTGYVWEPVEALADLERGAAWKVGARLAAALSGREKAVTLLTLAHIARRAGEFQSAFNTFGEDETTKNIPAILLVKRTNKAQIQRAQVREHRILLPLGLKIKQLRAKLFDLLKEEEPSSS